MLLSWSYYKLLILPIMITKELEQLKKENNFEHFYDKISSYVPSLNDFVARKLKIAESIGVLDNKFFKTNDILNEVYLEVFNSFNSKIERKDLKMMLFEKCVEKIDEKTISGHQFQNHINIDEILKEELQTMNEKFTVDGDGDFILYDELDDISYRQDDFKPTHFILDESLEKLMTEKLNLEDLTLQSDKKRKLLGSLFYKMPPKSRYIVELYVFGNQSVEDIAEILHLQEERVNEVIDTIKEKFKLIL